MKELHFVCTDFPGPGNECVFVECEDENGRGISAGEWKRDGRFATLVVPYPVGSLRLALETATRERDEARRHAEERLADVLELRHCGIEFASQYGDSALACRYDNSCDDSGREPSCVPCAFRRALGQKEVDRG